MRDVSNRAINDRSENNSFSFHFMSHFMLFSTLKKMKILKSAPSPTMLTHVLVKWEVVSPNSR